MELVWEGTPETVPLALRPSYSLTKQQSRNRRKLEAVQKFYEDVLGLEADPGRPKIPGVPGFWINVGGWANSSDRR
jgi:hypothetical protein